MFLLATARVAQGWGRNHLKVYLPISGGRCWLLAVQDLRATPTCSLSNVVELPPNMLSWFKVLAPQKRKQSERYINFMIQSCNITFATFYQKEDTESSPYSKEEELGSHLLILSVHVLKPTTVHHPAISHLHSSSTQNRDTFSQRASTSSKVSSIQSIRSQDLII